MDPELWVKTMGTHTDLSQLSPRQAHPSLWKRLLIWEFSSLHGLLSAKTNPLPEELSVVKDSELQCQFGPWAQLPHGHLPRTWKKQYGNCGRSEVMQQFMQAPRRQGQVIVSVSDKAAALGLGEAWGRQGKLHATHIQQGSTLEFQMTFKQRC